MKNHPLFDKYLNALSDYSAFFIIKGIESLKEGGELIFITSDYWMDTTHSLGLRNYIIENGIISEIYSFKEAPIFKNVNVSLQIFKFEKNINKKKNIDVFKYSGRQEIDDAMIEALVKKESHPLFEHLITEPFKKNQPWVIADKDDLSQIEQFEISCRKTNELSGYYCLEDVCDIGNGMVSGLDKAFQIDNSIQLNQEERESTLKVIKAKDLSPFIYKNITEYIFLNEIIEESQVKEQYPNFYNSLLPFKEKLLNRYSYNRDIKFWHWVFLRNYELFKASEQKIFVPCKERISNKDYHRFTIVDGDIFPTQDVSAIIPKIGTEESIEYICAHLNSDRVFNWIKHKGIVKGNIVEFSRAPLARIPFRKIDFNNKLEKNIHDEITELVKEYRKTGESKILGMIKSKMNELY